MNTKFKSISFRYTIKLEPGETVNLDWRAYPEISDMEKLYEWETPHVACQLDGDEATVHVFLNRSDERKS